MNEQELQFVDVYDVWYQPWWKSTAWYVSCAIIACVIFVCMLYYLYRQGWFVKKISCDQQALKSLNLLAAAPHDTTEKIYAAYFQLTLILKTYFAARYHLVLADKTDLEIMVEVKNFVDPIYQSLLSEFLNRAFQIKFAHEKICKEMLQDDIKFVKKIIEDTTRDFDKVGRS